VVTMSLPSPRPTHGEAGNPCFGAPERDVAHELWQSGTTKGYFKANPRSVGVAALDLCQQLIKSGKASDEHILAMLDDAIVANIKVISRARDLDPDKVFVAVYVTQLLNREDLSAWW